MNEYGKDLRDIYKKSISDIETPSQEHTLELAARIKQGDMSARDELVIANLRSVYKTAYWEARHQWPDMPPDHFMDLVQAGNEALLRAAVNYDPYNENAAKFNTYARACAVYEIHEEVKKLRDTQPNPYGRGIAKLSLDTVIIEEGNITLADMLSDEGSDPSEIMQREAELDELSYTIAMLDESELTALKYLYGIDCEEEKSYRAIGRKMGLSEYEVQSLITNATNKLKKFLK